MPLTRFNGLRKNANRTRRRRTSVLTKSKYKPRTTRANRSLIKANAYDIRKIRQLMPPSIYCDFQYSDVLAPFTASAPAPYFTIDIANLMEPNLWNAVLRQDPNVIDSSSTLVKRMQMNMRYALGESDWCQFTTFIVSLRKDASNRVISFSNLNPGQDYIYSALQNFNPRLNPAVFKVHYVRNVSLMSNGWLQPKAEIGPDDTVVAADSSNTFAKGQVNLKLNYRIRQPLGTPWRTMTQAQFPPHQRLYLMTFFRGQTKEPDDLAPRMDWDNLITTFNAS